MRRTQRNGTGLMMPGQELVAAGYAGLAGAIYIAREKRDELLSWFSQEYLEQIAERKNDVENAALHEDFEEWRPYGATECEPVLEGGILTALWNLSGAYGVGIRFSLRKIPIRQETVEICERYNLNPYRLWSEGCFLLTAVNGGELVRTLEAAGIPAAVIGRVTEGIGRIVEGGENAGYLERPGEDEIYKVLPQDTGT